MKSIDIFPWNDNFDTGIAQIDEQHRRLVQLLNRLASHLAFQSDLPALNVIFEELADYAAYHFATEEAIWRRYFPEDALETTHKTAHVGFVETLATLKAEQHTRPTEVIEKILAFLARWLAAHILESDRYLAMVVIAMQSGLPLDAAKQQARERMSDSTRALIDIILAIYESLSTNTLNLMRELSNRKRDEEALRRSQQRVWLLLASSPIGVCIAAASGRKIAYANPRYAKLVNIDVHHVTGRDPKQYYAEPKAYESILQELEQGAVVTDRLMEMAIPGVGAVWVLASYVNIDDDGQPAVLGWFYDVTHIRAAEAQLQILTDNVSDMISRHDPAGQCLYVTPACQSLLGYRADELLGRSCYEFFHADDVPALQAAHRQLLEQTETLTLVYRLRRKDGCYVWVESTARATRDADGNVVDIVIAARDISARKQVEAALAESRNLLRIIIDTAPVRIFWKDKDLRYLGCNPRFAKDAGVASPEQIVGKDDYQLGWKDQAESYRADDRKVMDTGVAKLSYEEPQTTPDGNAIWLQTSKMPLRDTRNNIIGVLGIYQDITARKQAADTLRKLSLAVEQSPSSIIITDLNANIEFVNHAFVATTGYSRAEALGHNPRLLQSGKTPKATHDDLWDKLTRGEVWQGEFINLRKDGSEYIEWATISPVYQADGSVTHYLAIKEDITERKRAEQRLQTAAQYARSLIEASLDPLVTIDATGKITDANIATEQVTGVDRNQLIGSDFADYFTDPDQARAGYRQAFSQGFVTDYPLAIRHVGGRITDVLYNASVYRDNNGNVQGLFAAARDITERKQMEARLAHSEAHLRAIIENEPECIKILDADGRIVQMNPAGLKMLEADHQNQIIGLSVFTMLAPEYHNAYAQLHERVLAGEAVQMEYEIIGLKGRRRWLETHAVPMKNADDRIVHLAVARDISKRKQAEQQQRIAAIVFESQQGMLVTDAGNVILRVNKAFTDITGYTPEEVIGKNPRLLQSGQHGLKFYQTMWRSIQNAGAWEGEIWNRRKSGEIYPQYLTITAVRDQNDAISHYVSTLTDITLKKAAAEEIERLAFFDPLTGLPNRRLLHSRLTSALATSRRSGLHGALLFIDLDNFKTINDTLGHDLGDVLLQQVAKRLSACVREGDTVARLGGDEFVIMLEDLSDEAFNAAKQAETVGNKILALMNKPFLLAAHDYLSTPSIGATLFKGREKSAEELLKHADIAMYQAKMSGRNTLRFFDPKMQDAITARVSLENKLRKALVNRQFRLYYQIQVDSHYRPLGAEALIRWQHPERGLVPPAEFVPLAEETDLIIPIGQWVLDAACAQLALWQQHAATEHLVLSINVSAKQFFQPDFAAQVHAAIQHHAINPARLKLELTESLLLKNVEDTVATMNTLRAAGIQFSLDDFGTGYSSLQYLKKLPLYQLKIDQSFVRDLERDDGDQIIVRTIIAMATSLNLGVIAEGVETEAQRQILLASGCLHYQGYLFGKPAPIAGFVALLKQAAMFNRLV